SKNATDLANLVAQVYIEQSHAEKAKMATHGRKFIEEQLSALEERTRVIEDSLKKIGEGTKNIKLAEPIEQKLLELQFQLGELSQKYTDRHPNIIQVREQIRQLEAQVKGFSGQEIDYSRLLREAEVNKKLYSMLKEKLEEARITEAQKISDVSVVDPAVSAIAPITVNTKAKILISLFMGLVLGLAFAFIIETMDTSMGTIEDVENIVKLPVVGVLPSIGQEGKEDNSLFARLRIRLAGRHKTDEEERAVHLVAHFNPQSTIAEAYRNVFTNLKLSSARKTIMVTSSGPREGKSTVVCNLGIVAAQVGLKTLIVSSDLRRPVVAKNFGISNEFGLRDLITGTMTIDQALKNITDIMMGEIKFDNIRKTPGIENITILPSGKPPSNPVELLESKKIDELISIFKVKFDVVIFDAAPILPVTDASILAPKMDCVAIVYEIGRTSRDALVRAKIQLENVGAKICGVILNHTRAQTEGINAYPYYYQYRYKYDTMHKESRLAKKETRKK
ncbi:MAG: polysaccharide biosynthesis tyrosine autokinase, partial [Candidatus Omnitrophica bacterium]|nr:polysaccharide biosynthesis tyrosine autokinase [Candidatus Omnitrophota bacterium]